jgi:hypothetical protein
MMTISKAIKDYTPTPTPFLGAVVAYAGYNLINATSVAVNPFAGAALYAVAYAIKALANNFFATLENTTFIKGSPARLVALKALHYGSTFSFAVGSFKLISLAMLTSSNFAFLPIALTLNRLFNVAWSLNGFATLATLTFLPTTIVNFASSK